MANQSPERESVAPAVEKGDALRCHCGSLLARLVPGGVEVKCRRCKRTIVIALDAEGKADVLSRICKSLK